jgi:hypothetical protein
LIREHARRVERRRMKKEGGGGGRRRLVGFGNFSVF